MGVKKPFLTIAIAMGLCCQSVIFSQEEIDLYEGEIPNLIGKSPEERLVDAPIGQIYFQVSKPTLKVFAPTKEKNTGIAAIICPGGSYSVLAYGIEVETAKRLAEEGITAFVLKYRLPDPEFYTNKEIVPIQDLQQAIIKVRSEASTWGVDPDKVGVFGSSAGGHLASTSGTHFNKVYVPNPKNISVRPDYLALSYPVISMADSLTHFQSRLRLISEDPIPEELYSLMRDNPKKADSIMSGIPVPGDKVLEYSNELQVTEDTPPTFINHAADDLVVPIQNSILFIAALQQNRVEVESFFYAKGGHGYFTLDSDNNVEWMDACVDWIKKRFLD